MELTREFVIEKGKLWPELAEALLRGVTKQELELLLEDTGGLTKQVLEIKRMNLIGGLRAQGFQITGGRGGGKVYQIVDWAEPAGPERTIDDLDEEHQHDLHEIVEKWPKLSTDQKVIDQHREALLQPRLISERLHESSILSILSYDVSGNEAYVYQEGNEVAVVVRRFKRTPVFRVIPISASYEVCFKLMETLVPLSFKPAKLLYVPEQWVKWLKHDWPTSSVEVAQEAIYATPTYASWPKKSDLKDLRRHDRETQFLELEWGGGALATSVIEEWRRVNEVKQRQLAIRRDYHSVLIDVPSKQMYVGIRNGNPVCLQVVDQTGKDIVAQITEKSLNYSSQPGGRSGTSDYSLWKLSQRLYEKGILWMNAGHVYGAESGLAEKKRKMASEIVNVPSITFPVEKP